MVQLVHFRQTLSLFHWPLLEFQFFFVGLHCNSVFLGNLKLPGLLMPLIIWADMIPVMCMQNVELKRLSLGKA
jgi:hypothetical protein